MFLIGNFLALPAFTEEYGIWNEATKEYVVETKWQSALQVSGQLEASHDETAVLALIAKSNEEELSDLPLAPQQRSHIHSW